MYKQESSPIHWLAVVAWTHLMARSHHVLPVPTSGDRQSKTGVFLQHHLELQGQWAMETMTMVPSSTTLCLEKTIVHSKFLC